MVVPPPGDLQHEEVLAEVRRVLRDDHGAPTIEGEIYPFCVGLIRFNDSVVRDTMISRGEQPLDEHSNFYLLRHDEGPNMCRPVIERDVWVMLLGFPLNYQTEHYIIKAVSCFGRCIYWHRPSHKISCVGSCTD